MQSDSELYQQCKQYYFKLKMMAKKDIKKNSKNLDKLIDFTAMIVFEIMQKIPF